jgi:tetratricopeptide (TPR) repeat protein
VILLILFSIFFFLNPFLCTEADAIGIETGSDVPDFTMGTVTGGPVALSDYEEKVLVMIYWRSDQKRSLLALDDGIDIYSRYQKKGTEIISIVSDSEDTEEIKKIIKKKKIAFPVLIDTGRKVYGSYGIRVYPTTVIIDREGKLNSSIPGHAVTYRTKLEGYIRHVLGEIDEAEMEDAIESRREARTDSELEAERKYNLAMKFTETGLVEQAIESAKGAIEANPDAAKAHVLLGFLYLETQEAVKAEEEFGKALEIEPRSHDAMTGLGGAMIAKGEIDSAIEILNEAARINPKPQMAYYELGSAYELKGDKDNAIKMYKMAIDKIIKKGILPSSVSSCN